MTVSKVINLGQNWQLNSVILFVLVYLPTIERVASVAVLTVPDNGRIAGGDDTFLNYFKGSFLDDPPSKFNRNRQGGRNSGQFQETPIMDKPGLFFPDAMNPWTPWSPCLRDAQTRTRGPPEMAILRKCGHLECLETRPCQSSSASLLPQWSTWAQWSQCTEAGGGTSERTRVRQCRGQSTRAGGTASSSRIYNLSCTGVAMERSACENRLKVAEVAQLTNWSPWSQCERGIQVRTRSCMGSVRCAGAQREIQICYSSPIDGHLNQGNPCLSLTPFNYRTCRW